jgi:hypothetical protein
MRPLFRAPAPCAVVLGALLLLLPTLALAEARVFVADQLAGTVRQFSSSGDDLGVFAGGLSRPSTITADEAGNVYVSEGGR